MALMDLVVTDDLRRNSVTWWIADPSVQKDWENPTVAEFLAALADGRMLDITCALDEENTSFTLGNPDLDARMSFCTGAGKDRGTNETPEATLGLYRDADRNANGVFNQALAWVQFPDTPFVLVQRVGDQDSGPDTDIGRPAKVIDATDDLRAADFMTDNPIDTLGADAPAIVTVTPPKQGFVLWNRKAA